MRTLDRALINTLEGVKVPKWQLKNIIGGCDPDGGELPDLEITCDSKGWGVCYVWDDCICYATGDPKDYCDPC